MVVSFDEVSVATRMRGARADARLRDELRAIVCDMLDQRFDEASVDVGRRLADLVNELVDPAVAAVLHHLESEFDSVLGSTDAPLHEWLTRRWPRSGLGIE